MKNGWKLVQFGDVVRLNKDRIADPAAAGIERYVGLEHITPEDLRIRNWGLVAEGTTFTNHFKPGQVLFGKRRAYQRKVAVADFEGVCSSDIYVFESKDPDVLRPELLPFICQSEGFYQHAVQTSAGSLSPRTNWKHLAAYEFPLPPLDEQRRIAELLWAVEDAIEKYTQFITSLIAIKLALMKQMISLPHITEKAKKKTNQMAKGWRVEELSNLVVSEYGIVDGPFGSNLKSIHYRDKGIPIIQSGFVTSGVFKPTKYLYVDEDKYNEQKRSAVRGGDIVMAKIGENCGACAIVPIEHPISILAGNCLKISPDNTKCLTKYLLYVLHFYREAGLLDTLKSTTAQPAIKIKDLKKLKIKLPPLEEQERIVKMLEAYDMSIKRTTIRKNNLHEIKKILLAKFL
ncbi:MAG: restriction endonuclease subunit S [Calditrichaeota bacterium]|nr:MAG: restriction endonuclease subunit S [Calditrichota bacterium]